MPVRKLDSGKWIAEIYPLGKKGDKRIRKQFSTKGEGLAFERYTVEKYEASPWLGEKTDKRPVRELATIWYNAQGITLNDSKKRHECSQSKRSTTSLDIHSLAILPPEHLDDVIRFNPLSGEKMATAVKNAWPQSKVLNCHAPLHALPLFSVTNPHPH